MKRILLLAIAYSFSCVSHHNDKEIDERLVLKAAFEDRANFEIMEFADLYKIPDTLVVLSQPKERNSYLFKLDSLDMVRLSDSSQRHTILTDEHHPYHHSYLFKHKNLDSLISADDRQYLYEQSLLKDTTQLNFQANGVQLIQSESKVKSGFWIVVTHPLFTKDKNIAVVDMEIHYKEHPTQKNNETYFGWHQVVYQRNDSGRWIKVGKSGNLFL